MSAQTVIVFAPHPDDEVIACGGTIIQHIAKGDNVHIIFSTDGRNSHTAVLNISVKPSPQELLSIRQKEAMACAEVLGVPESNLHFLNIEDTQMEMQQELYSDKLTKLLTTFNQIDVVYLPHDVREANIDHRLTGKLALKNLSQTNHPVQINKYIVWTQETEKQVSFSNRGTTYLNEDEVADEKLIEIDISQQLAQKKMAFMQHDTQVSLYGESQDRAVLPVEFCERVYQSKIEYFWRRAS